MDMDTVDKQHWENQQNQPGATLKSTWCHTAISFHGESWQIFLGNKKLGMDLKKQSLDHTSSMAANTYWTNKSRFQK